MAVCIVFLCAMPFACLALQFITLNNTANENIIHINLSGGEVLHNFVS